MDGSPSNACMLLERHHPQSPRPRASRELLSSGTGHALLLLCDSYKCPLTECRIIAKFVRSVHSLSTWAIGPASHFPLEVEAQREHHLGPSQHHQWMKMWLLIHSKSHNQNAQKDLDKNSGPGYCHCTRLCLVLFGNLPCLLPALASWMKCFWGYLWKEWSWGRQEAVGFMAPWSYYWSWPSLWLPLDKEYANTWGSEFYSQYLFVSSLCLGM